jgi:probable rRNA maturation factor
MTRYWGDIFIAPVYVRKESERRAISFHEELLRVMIHGMLHLMGYDHATKREEREMFGLQEHALHRVINVV